MGVQACRLPALKRLKSWGSKPAVCHASSCSQHPPFAMLHPAANRHPKATHQWLLMGVQACGGPSLPFAMLHPAANRPALKPLTPLKTFQRLTTLTTRHGGPSLPCAMLHRAANRHPKATHQWLLMGVQACGGPSLPFAMLHPAANRPALKPLTPLKTLQRLTTLATRHGGPSLPCAVCHASSCSQPAPQGHTWASKPAVCQPLNA